MRSEEIEERNTLLFSGAMQNTTPSRNIYFLRPIDDYSPYFTVFFLPSKNIAFEKIELFIEQLEN